jgi:hypothetical protein
VTVLVFLHIPKTAGQTVHNALTRAVGQRNVSPVRVHTQASSEDQFPPGYRLYSGHLDWTALEGLPPDRFVFSVLREPRERIASFYFYVRKEAAALSEEDLARPENVGKYRALHWTAEEYFFGGDPPWQQFVRDHYDNFYCSYFATRKMRGLAEVSGLPDEERIRRAVAGTAALDALYSTVGLARLEADVARILGKSVPIACERVNRGPLDPGLSRWRELLGRLGGHGSTERLEAFATLDDRLLGRLGIPV